MISTKLTFLSPSSSESVRSLYEIHVEQSDVRIPTHFVLLLDTSGSMEQDNKLENVKKCVELLMNILNSNDKISVITFADDSKIILESVPADAVHKGSILQKVNSIQADGSTNLSASIVNLQKVIQNESMKIGVIVLTDGHANMGVHDTPTLTTMFRTIREKNPLLTMACLAYGTDHNAELCKAISQEGSGSYAIVSNLENAATAIGDTFGSFVSCCAQNVELHLPLDATMEGPFTLTDKNTYQSYRIGDLFTGSQTLHVINLPGKLIRENKPLVSLHGTKIPGMEVFEIACDTGAVHLERHRDTELTLLRYRCAALFKSLTKWDSLTGVQRANLQEDIHRFDTDIQEQYFNGHAVAEMLRTEAKSLETSVKLLVERRVNRHAITTHLIQHENVMSTGHGYTHTIEEPDDPDTHEVCSALPADLTSPFQNNHQRRIAHVMRTMSQRP